MQRFANSKNRGVVCGEESHFVTLWETLFRTRRKSVVDKGQSKVAGSIPTPSPLLLLGWAVAGGCGMMYPQKWLTRGSIQRPFVVPLRPRPSKRTPVPPLSRRYPCSLSLSRSLSLSLSLFGSAGHRCLWPFSFRKLSKPAKKEKKKDSSIGVRDPGGGRGGILEGLWKPSEVVGRPTKRGPLPRRLRLTHHTATLEGNFDS